MFIVEINSNKLMNAGQIPTNRRDHVGVVLDRGPKWQVNSLTDSVEKIRWRKHSTVLIASLVPAASKSTKHSPESLSIRSLGCHRRRSRIRPPFRYFYEKTLAKNDSTNDRIATQRYSSRLGHCVIWTKWRRLVVGVLESNDDGTAAG